ncbi:MAG: universal stress protein [Deltaproteobacteria bacterium]|nr:universal stress protein [Deltaproteobacteria bacterium]
MKILVPLDGSEYSNEALQVAIDFARTKGAQISIISVVPYIGGMDDHEISPSRMQRHMEGFEKRADEIINQGWEVLTAAGLEAGSTRSVIESASVPDAIIDYAEKEKTDLIVMGSRGLSPSARFKLGSVASQVAKYSPCSVYLVKIPARG